VWVGKKREPSKLSGKGWDLPVVTHSEDSQTEAGLVNSVRVEGR